MRPRVTAQVFPAHVWVLFVLYFIASTAHFVHNAEYIAYYPNMPAWITRETVYTAWLAELALGLLGTLLAALGWRITSSLLVGAYGALGLDGLLHYTLALCSEHGFVANLTIWSEASLGLLLLLASAVVCVRHVKQHERRSVA